MSRDNDRQLIENIIREFFKLFASADVRPVRLDTIRPMFLTQAKIIKTCGAEPVIYSIDEFIQPREKLLTDGTLVEFTENEISMRTEIFGDVAQTFVLYGKRGVHHGERFDEKGMKTVQFVRMPDGWKISAMAWDDERAGLKVPDSLSFA